MFSCVQTVENILPKKEWMVIYSVKNALICLLQVVREHLIIAITTDNRVSVIQVW